MRAHPGQFQVGIASRKLKERGQCFGLDAQSVHTRVDLHVHRPALLQLACRLRLAARRPAPSRRGAEPLQLTDVVDDWREALFQHLGVGVTVVSAQHQDRTGDARTTKLQTFFYQRNRQCINHGREHPRHCHGAMSIGIRLHHAIDGHLRSHDGPYARDVAAKCP